MQVDLKFLIYRSRALFAPRSDTARNISEVSLSRNMRHAITGYLHQEDGALLQYIEGPEDALGRLFGNIARDKRHIDLVLLANGILPGRRFADWKMASTDEGGASFARHQDGQGRAERIDRASADHLLDFMLITAPGLAAE